MRQKILVVCLLLAIPIVMAASITGSGLNQGALGSLYCALTGCTMTGAITDLTSAGTVALSGTSIVINSDAGDAELTVDDTSIAVLANDVTFERTTAGNNLLAITNDQSNKGSGISMFTDSGGANPRGIMGVRLNANLNTGNLRITMNNFGGNEGITVHPTGPTRIKGTSVPGGFCDSADSATDEQDGAMWYEQTANGSGLCICMFNGTTYEVVSALTLGTFAAGNCN